MRPTIESAIIAISKEQWDTLADGLAAFEQELHKLRPPPSPERLSVEVKRAAAAYRHRSFETRREERLTQAHQFYFMPTDAAKIWMPLAELHAKGGPAVRKVLHVLELGDSAGAASLGILLYLASVESAPRVSLTIVGQDPTQIRMIEDSCQVLTRLPVPRFKERIETSDVKEYLYRPVPARFDLVVLTDALSGLFPSESFAQEAAALFRRILTRNVKRSGFLIVLEPALPRFSRMLVAAGSRFEQDGGVVYAPVPFQALCKQLERPGAFSFHSTPVPLTRFLQSVSVRSRIYRHEVNYSYLTMSRTGTRMALPDLEVGQVPGRVMSFPRRVKKGFEYFVACPQGMITAFAPRILADGKTKGGKLPIGALVGVKGVR